MKLSINDLHKAFENRTRIGIMSALLVNDNLDFNALKEYLDVTDGNLATHIKKLENEKFISVRKSFIDNKPNTKYTMTTDGKNAFVKHITAFENILKSK